MLCQCARAMVVRGQGDGGVDDDARPDRARYHENKIGRGADRFFLCERTESDTTAQTQPELGNSSLRSLLSIEFPDTVN